MKKRKLILGLVAGVALITLAACGSSNTGSSSSNSGSGSSISGTITATGSTALQPLVTAAKSSFQTANPNAQVTIQGGGSGAGLTAVSTGTATIGNSDIFAEQKSGIDASQLTDNKVAAVGFAPVVNKDAGVSKLTQQQLIDIFTGKVTNWSKVGGKNLAITVVERTAGSGTRVNFDMFGLNGAQEVANATSQDASGAVVTQVDSTSGSISYLAFDYLKQLTNSVAVNIAFDGKTYVEPTAANVVTNKWTIWGYEHMYTKGKGSAADNAFIKYVANDTKDQTSQGFIPIGQMKGTRSESGKWTAN